jgi:hypothetical protein
VSGWHLALLIAVFATDLVVFVQLCLDELRPRDRSASRDAGLGRPHAAAGRRREAGARPLQSAASHSDDTPRRAA